MGTPEPQPAGATRARALIRFLFQSGNGRNAAIIVLFGLLVLTARGTAPAPATVGHPPPAAAAPSSPIADLAATLPANRAPDATALDNLLSRFDVLIRLLEARAVETGQDSRALAELRALRETVYLTSRKALAETDSAHAARR